MAHAAAAEGSAPTKAAKEITMRVVQLQREYIAGGMGRVQAAAEAIKKASVESRQRAPKR